MDIVSKIDWLIEGIERPRKRFTNNGIAPAHWSDEDKAENDAFQVKHKEKMTQYKKLKKPQDDFITQANKSINKVTKSFDKKFEK